MRKSSDAQRRAVAKYDATNTRKVTIKLNINTDADIIAKLEAVDNMQGYIKKLIRGDINNK